MNRYITNERLLALGNHVDLTFQMWVDPTYWWIKKTNKEREEFYANVAIEWESLTISNYYNGVYE